GLEVGPAVHCEMHVALLPGRAVFIPWVGDVSPDESHDGCPSGGPRWSRRYWRFRNVCLCRYSQTEIVFRLTPITPARMLFRSAMLSQPCRESGGNGSGSEPSRLSRYARTHSA